MNTKKVKHFSAAEYKKKIQREKRKKLISENEIACDFLSVLNQLDFDSSASM